MPPNRARCFGGAVGSDWHMEVILKGAARVAFLFLFLPFLSLLVCSTNQTLYIKIGRWSTSTVEPCSNSFLSRFAQSGQPLWLPRLAGWQPPFAYGMIDWRKTVYEKKRGSVCRRSLEKKL